MESINNIHKSCSHNLDLCIGKDGFELFSNADFLNGWDTLYDSCPWGTIFQSRKFVTTWYHTYEKVYIPIIVKAELDGQLTGLLTMALNATYADLSEKRKQGIRIIGAGYYDAEYQTWLSDIECSDKFIKEAIEMIRKRFPFRDIYFRYLPPKVPLDWIKYDEKIKKTGVLQSFTRPLMNLNDPNLHLMFRKKEFRNKLNRLKRLGTYKFEFEKLLKTDNFLSVINELSDQFDFRQGAVLNKNQFRDNPLKARFLIALFQQGLLHVTLLKIDDKIIASILAVDGGDWVHLGAINTLLPSYAKHSPGFVHFLLLGQKLAEEGHAMFDLTTGGDAYKERLANQHDKVVGLMVTNRRSYFLKRALRKYLSNILEKLKIRPMSVELSIKKQIYLLKNRIKLSKETGSIDPLLNYIKNRKTKNQEFFLKVYNSDELLYDVTLKKNNLDDLLKFESIGTTLSRWEFLEDAMKRFEDGGTTFTLTENAHLISCIWAEEKISNNKESVFNLKADAVFQLIYCHPDGRNKFEDFMKRVTGTFFKNQIENKTYVIAASSENWMTNLLEESGFSKVIGSKNK